MKTIYHPSSVRFQHPSHEGRGASAEPRGFWRRVFPAAFGVRQDGHVPKAVGTTRSRARHGRHACRQGRCTSTASVVFIIFKRVFQDRQPHGEVVVSPRSSRDPKILGQGKRIASSSSTRQGQHHLYHRFSIASADNNEATRGQLFLQLRYGRPYRHARGVGLCAPGRQPGAREGHPRGIVRRPLGHHLQEETHAARVAYRLARPFHRQGHRPRQIPRLCPAGRRRRLCVRAEERDAGLQHDVVVPTFRPDNRQDTNGSSRCISRPSIVCPIRRFLPGDLCCGAFNEVLHSATW
jgi:hypothetical protein